MWMQLYISVVVNRDSSLGTAMVLEWPGDVKSPALLCEQVMALCWAADLQGEGASRWQARTSGSFYCSGQPLAFLWLLFLLCCKSLMAVTLCFSLHRGDTTNVTKNPPGCDLLACGFSPL